MEYTSPYPTANISCQMAEKWTVVIVLGCVLAISALGMLALKHNSEEDAEILLVARVLFSLFNYYSDVLVVVMLHDSPFDDLYKAGVVFITLPLVLNTVLSMVTWVYVLRDPGFKKWTNKHATEAAVVFLVSLLNVSLFDLASAKLLKKSKLFAAPMPVSYTQSRKRSLFKVVVPLFEDVPVMILSVVFLSRSPSQEATRTTLVSVVLGGLSILLVLVSSILQWLTHQTELSQIHKSKEYEMRNI